jgi:hypothetical protein
MTRICGLLALVSVLVLGGCSQPQVSDVPSPQSDQAILEEMRALNLEPEVLEAYSEALNTTQLSAARLAQSSGTVALAQEIALVSVAVYDNYYDNKANYSQFDWGRNGCSAPEGLGLGYRNTFRPACNVHDFGYTNFSNLPALANERGRKAADDSFLVYMNRICAKLNFFERPTCYPAAYLYYTAVRVGGAAFFYNIID